MALNEHWKIPIGYFLNRSLNGIERLANLLTLAMEFLHKVNCKVYSVTFDGANSNISMCITLGANLNYNSNFKPYFTNPTSEICYIFYDFCHMIKLIRNILGDKKIIKITNGKSILWSYMEKLYEMQCKEGLRVANKLTKKHIYYQNNRINVKLAIQTFSESVYNSFQFFKSLDDKEIQNTFKNCSETALFCLNFNNMGDMLNCKNRFSKREFDAPLNNENYTKMKENAENFEKYITTLCDVNGNSILTSN